MVTMLGGYGEKSLAQKANDAVLRARQIEQDILNEGKPKKTKKYGAPLPPAADVKGYTAPYHMKTKKSAESAGPRGRDYLPERFLAARDVAAEKRVNVRSGVELDAC